ncbi:MAG TPA: MBL fold metallo-hydrolase [Chitinophagaceae bacterium]|nr:MBL fold metallo-hydrolase [Chitinophagaceae bacterium]
MKYEIQLIRHATLLVRTQQVSFLVDPMLSPKDAMDPVANAASSFRIPMVDLPFDEAWLEETIRSVDAVLVTHLHRDHWDAAAIEKIPKNKPIFCQPTDAATIRDKGFTQVTGIELAATWKGISLVRTNGRHGTGEIGDRMGKVSGFILGNPQGDLYIAGDTIWCEEVAWVLATYQPAIIVVNSGGARFLSGDPITMTADQVIQVHKASPDSTIVAVHMDTVNHCLEKRSDLRLALRKAGISNRVLIPEDGQTIVLSQGTPRSSYL